MEEGKSTPAHLLSRHDSSEEHRESKCAGKLIVFDGNDGSGKQTQVEMLVARLEKEGKQVRTIDFPRYYDNFFGQFIGRCLTGEFGDFLNYDPHIISVLYGNDRLESMPKIREWLEKGYIVIADRYVSANQIHQGGKIKDEMKRREFMEWLDKMEFEVLGLARPDLVIYFDMDVERSLENLKGKSPQKYAGGKADQTESDLQYLTNSRNCALWLTSQSNSWQTVKCDEGGKMRTREEIHREVYDLAVSMGI